MSYGGDRSTPLLVYWIIYQSDQLGEVGVCWKRGSENPCIGREREGWHFGRPPKIEGSMGLLREQRVKQFGITFAIRMRAILIRALASVSIKIALSFHPALPPQNSFINILHVDTFDEGSQETTLHTKHTTLNTI